MESPTQKHDYKFVRLGEGWLTAGQEAKETYQETIRQHAVDGWRLIQIFAPGIAMGGTAKYFEIVLERGEHTTSPTQKHDYKFVRLGEGLLAVGQEAKETYQETIRQHAVDGWRLVQIFAPGIGRGGTAKYYEIILEREVSIHPV